MNPKQTEMNEARNDEQVIDWQDLVDRLVDEQIIYEIIPYFFVDNRHRMEMLKDAVEQNNRSEVRMQSHTLKGSAANISARRLSKTAHQLEVAAMDGNTDVYKTLFENVQAEFKKLDKLLARPDWAETAKKQSIGTAEK